MPVNTQTRRINRNYRTSLDQTNFCGSTQSTQEESERDRYMAEISLAFRTNKPTGYIANLIDTAYAQTRSNDFIEKRMQLCDREGDYWGAAFLARLIGNERSAERYSRMAQNK
jgi:hypothetical protein